ncbi:YodC family protein [Asticcacaulis tiandongensis]|uniref:YodC family protein n=1 Tax=Asticcacaulis tiandongensis TaxID=2565365 RepID=UPI001125D81D|nr:DUF2158 domain-containing protein [Asticcacaulis tiandongensis]
MAFSIGENVQFKDGGPFMTVSNIDGDGYVYCEWFDDHNDRHTDKFREDLLIHAEITDAHPTAAPSL